MRYALQLLMAATAASASLWNPVRPRQQTCYNGVYQIAARGSDEAPGTAGIIGSVAQNVSKGIPDSHILPLDYPATLSNYFTSEGKGTTAMTKAIQDYVDACPDGRIVLMGYSQGAAVVGDTICGTSDSSQQSTPPLDYNKYGKHIVAILGMGDPNFVINQPWDRGTNTQKNGSFPRLDNAACKPYANIWRSYCNTNDLFCASGSSLLVHESYTLYYGPQAAQFLISTAKNATVSGSNNSSSGGASPTSTGQSSGSGSSNPSSTGTTGTGANGGMPSQTGAMGAQQTGAAVRITSMGSSASVLFGISLVVALGM